MLARPTRRGWLRRPSPGPANRPRRHRTSRACRRCRPRIAAHPRPGIVRNRAGWPFQRGPSQRDPQEFGEVSDAAQSQPSLSSANARKRVPLVHVPISTEASFGGGAEKPNDGALVFAIRTRLRHEIEGCRVGVQRQRDGAAIVVRHGRCDRNLPRHDARQRGERCEAAAAVGLFDRAGAAYDPQGFRAVREMRGRDPLHAGGRNRVPS